MTREETKAAIAVMQAYVDGAEIEWSDAANQEWRSAKLPAWDWLRFDYRINPKPKLELRVGAWYEDKNGHVLQCFHWDDRAIYNQGGVSCIKISHITREVRVLPVEE